MALWRSSQVFDSVASRDDVTLVEIRSRLRGTLRRLDLSGCADSLTPTWRDGRVRLHIYLLTSFSRRIKTLRYLSAFAHSARASRELLDAGG